MSDTGGLWKAVVETLPSAVAILDSEATILATNRRWRTFGMANGLDDESADSVGQNYLAVTDAADDEYARTTADGLRALLSGETAEFDLEYPCHSPEEKRWFLLSARALEHDGDRYVLVEHVDITDRKLAELTVRDRNQRLEALHEATQELLGTDTREAATECAVRSLEEALGLSMAGLWLHDPDRDVLVPTSFTEQGNTLVDPPVYDGAGTASYSWRAFTTGRIYVIDDLSNAPNRHNEETVLRSEIVLPLEDHGVLNVASTEPDAFDEVDVTLAELWASTVSEVLTRFDRERRLSERERELERERDRLDEFASLVSHDLRNPLNVAMGHLQIAAAECDSDHIDTAEGALSRMDELIENLLMLARQGRIVGETEPVALADLAERCWANVETTDATIVVDTDLSLMADESRLAQLFENLYRNAIEHGGATVTVSVGALTDGDGFFVEDDGPGIPTSEREQVFEPGYTTGREGTGFGLSIVAEVADAHGWTIEVTDGADGGARFEVRGVELAE